MSLHSGLDTVAQWSITVVVTKWTSHSGWHTVVGWYTVVTQRSSHSGHNTKVEWSSHGVHHKVRQLVRKMSNFHKSIRFVIYCAAYGAERLFSLVSSIEVLSSYTVNKYR